MEFFPKTIQAMKPDHLTSVDELLVFGGGVFKEDDLYIWTYYNTRYSQARLCAATYDVRLGATINSKSIPLIKL
ncbi:hypothetical protein VCRA2123O444_100072 [Vibrio crassostreae]|nr:hypothetical protein EDB67_10926 [Vibrio crassostreae]TCN66904.1 hypothetical protein EDB60_11095 [Vibrio crassostreae]CAK1696480.1 hypothetical protein VCRA2119O431_100071 [Vibrio crassostreae]CAK1700882.1 hypothetical protein VCRA2114O422_100084 [Vibrio crassostreae]CAK1718620.1 hypothetical protein VCRA2119O430_110084 [Vibrio crassostreae]